MAHLISSSYSLWRGGSSTPMGIWICWLLSRFLCQTLTTFCFLIKSSVWLYWESQWSAFILSMITYCMSKWHHELFSAVGCKTERPHQVLVHKGKKQSTHVSSQTPMTQYAEVTKGDYGGGGGYSLRKGDQWNKAINRQFHFYTFSSWLCCVRPLSLAMVLSHWYLLGVITRFFFLTNLSF